MPIRVRVGDRVHVFPDDATEADIADALEAAEADDGAPSSSAMPGSLGVKPELQRPDMLEVNKTPIDPRQYAATQAGWRQTMRGSSPVGFISQPLSNMTSDPARREQFGDDFRDLARGIAGAPRELAGLDYARLGQDTMRAGGEAVENLPETAGEIWRNIPQIARAVTYGPFEDEENAQREIDLARARGDQAGVRRAAGEANAATGGVVLNTGSLGVGSLVRTPLQAAALAVGIDAPLALSRNSDQPLQERLPDALTEMGGAAAFGGTTQYLANQLPRLLRRPPRTGRAVEQFDRAEVDPSLAAANGGGVSGMVTNAIGDNIAAGPVVRARGRRQLTQTRDASQRIGVEYGEARDLQGAGNVVQQGIERFARDRNVPNPEPAAVDPRTVSTRNWSFASKAEAVFDEALRPLLDNAAPLTRTIATLDEIGTQADAPAVRAFQADPTLTRFERLARRLQRGAADGFEPAAADDVAAMATEIENAGRVGTTEQSLATWVRRRGGVKDDRGDIRGADPRGRGASAVLSQGGRSIDDLATSAWEDGFFPGDRPPTAREFMDALDSDLRAPGSVLRPGDEAARATTSNAREILQYYEQQGVDVTLRGEALRRALRPLTGIDEGTGGRPPTLRDLRELRRKVRMAQTVPGLGQTVDNASLQRIEQALTHDIYAAAGDGAANLRAADRFYRTGRQRIENALSEFVGPDPGKVIPRILALARPNGNARTLAALRGALRDDEWRVVAASIIEHMGQPTPGAAGFIAELGFSPTRFATAWRAMSPRARSILFGSRGGPRGPRARALRDLADELENLAAVAQNLKSVEAVQNHSRTAPHLANLATGAAATANLPATLAAIAALGLIGELFTNPAAVRWMTSAPKVGRANSQGMRRWLSDLAALSSRDPALLPVYNELTQSQAPESGRPAYGSPDRQRSPQPVP